MSLLFKRVTKLEYQSEHSFALSGAIYEMLIGDRDMPVAQGDKLADVVTVDVDKLAAILLLYGTWRGDTLDDYKRVMTEAIGIIEDTDRGAINLSNVYDGIEEHELQAIEEDYNHAMANGLKYIQYTIL